MLNQIIKPVDELNFSVKKDANQQEVRNYIATYYPTRSDYELKELSRAFHIINDNIETACGRGLSYCIVPLNEIVKGIVPRSVSITTDMRLFNDIGIELKNKGYDYTFVSMSKFKYDPKFIAISLNNNNDVNEGMYDAIRELKNNYNNTGYIVMGVITLIVGLIAYISTL